MADQVNVQVIIEKDMGVNGTWRDALYLPLNEYLVKQQDGSFENWKEAIKQERYNNYLRIITPDPVVELQSQAQIILDQISSLAQDHQEVANQIKELDPQAEVKDISSVIMNSDG